MRAITIVFSTISIIVLYPISILLLPIGIVSDIIHSLIGFVINVIGNAIDGQLKALQIAAFGEEIGDEGDE